MKANTNHLPFEFKKYEGETIEANLAELAAEYPLFKGDILRCINGYSEEPVNLDFDDESYIIRFLIKNGEMTATEIGRSGDEWSMLASYKWEFGKITAINEN